MECCAVEMSRRRDADGAASCEDAVGGDRLRCREPSAPRFESPDEQVAACASAESCRPAGLEGIADSRDAGLLDRTNNGARDARKQVRVFVRVDVCKLEAGLLQLLDLRQRLALDFVLPDGAAKDAEREVAE